MYNPSHPGEILSEYVNSTKKTITEVAEGLGISRKVLSSILNQRAGISTEMAIKLSVAFNTSVDFWVNLQKQYEIYQSKLKVDTSKIRHFRDEYFAAS